MHGVGGKELRLTLPLSVRMRSRLSTQINVCRGRLCSVGYAGAGMGVVLEHRSACSLGPGCVVAPLRPEFAREQLNR